jgi:carbohydrate kinase (thermoresistant glucokinase family)
MVIVLIGPMGCGKTTIGLMLAEQLDWPFYDGDDFHPEANKKKMGQGIALDDADRQPWLEILHQLIEQHLAEGKSMILACSALKKIYRDLLGIDQRKVFSVFLKGSEPLLQQRIASRSHEYMPEDLLASQLQTLEEPMTGITVDISGTPEEAVAHIVKALID